MEPGTMGKVGMACNDRIGLVKYGTATEDRGKRGGNEEISQSKTDSLA